MTFKWMWFDFVLLIAGCKLIGVSRQIKITQRFQGSEFRVWCLEK